jgi:hypothetical protein
MLQMCKYTDIVSLKTCLSGSNLSWCIIEQPTVYLATEKVEVGIRIIWLIPVFILKINFLVFPKIPFFVGELVQIRKLMKLESLHMC